MLWIRSSISIIWLCNILSGLWYWTIWLIKVNVIGCFAIWVLLYIMHECIDNDYAKFTIKMISTRIEDFFLYGVTFLGCHLLCDAYNFWIMHSMQRGQWIKFPNKWNNSTTSQESSIKWLFLDNDMCSKSWVVGLIEFNI